MNVARKQEYIRPDLVKAFGPNNRKNPGIEIVRAAVRTGEDST